MHDIRQENRKPVTGERFSALNQNLFNDPILDPICRYRYCDELIPPKRLRYHAEYCSGLCGRLERKELKSDDRKNRYKQTLLTAEEFDRKFPKFYQELKWQAIDLMGKFPFQDIDFRVIVGLAKMYTGIKVNNNHLKYFRLKLEDEFPELRLGKKRERKK